MFEDFSTVKIDAGETTIFVRSFGSGPPILLLHGFPQTHLMWRRVAPLLTRNFTVVCADLRGYGNSGCPLSTADHTPYSKRAMAQDMVKVMEQLGFQHFSVAGHDRAGACSFRSMSPLPGISGGRSSRRCARRADHLAGGPHLRGDRHHRSPPLDRCVLFEKQGSRD